MPDKQRKPRADGLIVMTADDMPNWFNDRRTWRPYLRIERLFW